jgi:Flp pilus assembly protein TadB
MSSVYIINKGVNRPIVFRGLKAQYIWWLAIGLGGLLVLFAFLYILSVPVTICMAIILVAGLFLFRYVYRMNNRYGEHGMMKALAKKSTLSGSTVINYLSNEKPV